MSLTSKTRLISSSSARYRGSMQFTMICCYFLLLMLTSARSVLVATTANYNDTVRCDDFPEVASVTEDEIREEVLR